MKGGSYNSITGIFSPFEYCRPLNFYVKRINVLSILSIFRLSECTRRRKKQTKMKLFKNMFLFSLCLAFLFSCAKNNQHNEGTGGQSMPQIRNRVRVGLDVLIDEHLPILKGKKVGIITNQTGISSAGEHIVDILSRLPGISVSALFAPEHGIRGDLPDGEEIASYIDAATGIRVWSLYGQHQKPTAEMIKEVDMLIYDIQDVGARFYTFISTLGLAMEAASEYGKAFVVLDRPNPINGLTIEGPIIEEKYFSFVGQYPIPVRYGMTPGEMAQMIKGEGWIEQKNRLDLQIISMKGWTREMWYDETGLPWVRPSPNIPSVLTAALYPGLCLVEALNISEGRGTMRPFEQIGAPWIDSSMLARTMNEYSLPGIYFRPVTFTPVSIPGAAPWNKYRDQQIHGLDIIITDREKLRSLQVMVYLLITLEKLSPEKLELRDNLERLIGIQSFRHSIKNLRPPAAILKEWETEMQKFKELQKKYLLY
jgi:uncharacterized protein YbbC (DUF1343 family)